MTNISNEMAELEKRKNMDEIYTQLKQKIFTEMDPDPSIFWKDKDNVEMITAENLQSMNLSLGEKLDLAERVLERDVALRVSQMFGNRSMNDDIDVNTEISKLEIERFPVILINAQKIIDKNLGTNEADLIQSKIMAVEKQPAENGMYIMQLFDERGIESKYAQGQKLSECTEFYDGVKLRMTKGLGEFELSINLGTLLNIAAFIVISVFAANIFGS